MRRSRSRPAREDDREAVLAFCARTWDDGDYIQYVWEDWLRDTSGALLVATLAGRPVGLCASAHDVAGRGMDRGCAR